MGREGRKPNGSGPAYDDHTGDLSFGDGTDWMVQQTPSPSSTGSTKSGRERRTAHWGGFGIRETDDPIRR
jgi:hypothetical protein